MHKIEIIQLPKIIDKLLSWTNRHVFSHQRQTFEIIIGHEKKIPYDAIKLLRDRGPAAIIKIIKDYPKATLLYSIFILGWFLVTYTFAVKGIIILFKNNEWIKVSFLLLPIFYFILLTGQAGLARFKLPIIPFYCLLIAKGSMWGGIKIDQNK